MTGNVVMDANADREPNYWVWAINEGGDRFNVWTEVDLTGDKDQPVSSFTTR